jgi:arsenical pump membrane protein
LILASALLAAALATAVVRPPWMPEAIVAAAGAAVLVAVGAIGGSDAVDALTDLAPTVGFLAALLILAEGCRNDGLFEAIGSLLAVHARGRRGGCWRSCSASRSASPRS